MLFNNNNNNNNNFFLLCLTCLPACLPACRICVVNSRKINSMRGVGFLRRRWFHHRFLLPNTNTCFVSTRRRTTTTILVNPLSQIQMHIQMQMQMSRRFKHSHSHSHPPNLDREFMANLWLLDNKHHHQQQQQQQQYKNHFSNHVFHQPPLSQSPTGFLAPTSPDEAQIAPLLARSNLLITRDIEWMNLMFGFEQENRYAIVDVCYPHSPVGFIREESNVLLRQFLRLRRPFTAYITDAMGNELFRIRRPFWWITSSIYAEVNGKEIGVVHQRWHLWRRIYDLYLENKQFAVVENPGLWCWTFTLKDSNSDILAQIDRDWRGFGFEIFTDAGQYVIRFGSSDPALKTGPAKEVEDLEVARPLTLSERAVALALAVSLDNDYFSRHGGWGIPFVAVGE